MEREKNILPLAGLIASIIALVLAGVAIFLATGINSVNETVKSVVSENTKLNEKVQALEKKLEESAKAEETESFKVSSDDFKNAIKLLNDDYTKNSAKYLENGAISLKKLEEEYLKLPKIVDSTAKGKWTITVNAEKGLDFDYKLTGVEYGLKGKVSFLNNVFAVVSAVENYAPATATTTPATTGTIVNPLVAPSTTTPATTATTSAATTPATTATTPATTTAPVATTAR